MTPAAREEPYGRDELLPLYAPASIAIVGASPRAGSFGQRTAANLSGFDGAVHLINAKYQEIDGKPCYPSLKALPKAPDLAVVTTPASTVEEVIEDCIASGVPAALVYASGFAETGDGEDAARQARLLARSRASGLKLLGPNCVGLLNYRSGARITFAGVPEGRVAPGGPSIGLISQSGALGFALAQAMDRGVRFSHVLSCGNSADVDVADWIAALAEEPDCSAIACAFEGLADPRRFLRAAERAWRRDKPLVVFKLATGEEGAAAAMSHTASLAGSHALWNALFEKAGAIVVEDFDALIETAYFFAKAPAPKADGAAVISGSGGAAILGADFAETENVPLPQPTPAVVERLRSLIPPFVQPRNPCDVTAQVINDRETLLNCADALLGDPNYGTLIFGYTYAYDTATQRQPHLSRLAARHGKPVCFAWLTQLLEGPGAREAESDPHLVVFRSMRRCFRTLKAWTDRARRRRTEAAKPPARAALPNAEAIARMLASAGEGALGERDSKQLLSLCGVSIPHERRVGAADEAAEAAREIGGRLAMKIDSPDIPHKTEAGGVALGIAGPEATRQAFGEIVERCRKAAPAARILGVNVQEMIPSGLEVIVGVRRVAGFGPTVTVGLGGVLTEILRDTTSMLAPVDEAEAEAMLRRLRGARLFDGFRGSPPVDMAKLAHAVSAMSRLGADFGDRIEEIEVNPLICLPDRVVAVDGMAVLRDDKTGRDAGRQVG